MSKKQPHLCEYKKDEIKDDLKALKKLVTEPKFICRKCARAANTKDVLCKPEKIDD